MFNYLLVLSIVDLHAGAAFDTDLPTHCTVMPWFSLPEGKDSLDLYPDLSRIAAETTPIVLLAERETHFRGGMHPVSLLKWDESLIQLHDSILDFLREIQAEIITPAWVGRAYAPHVSTDVRRIFPPGTWHHADRLILISRNTDGTKRVVEKFMFN